MKFSLGKLFTPPTNLFKTMGHQFNIGLDLGPDRLNMVQLENHAGNIRIRAMASLPYPCPRQEVDSDTLKALVKKAYANEPFKGKRIVSCMPADKIKILTVSYHSKEGQSDEDAVVSELQDRYKDELSEMVVDFKILRHGNEHSNKREALVALAPREQVISYLELLSEAGLTVDSLDIGPAALTRLVSHVGSIISHDFPQSPNALLINFGAESSFVTVIWGRRLMLDRSVAFSENRLVELLNKVLDMPKEVALSLLYQNTNNNRTSQEDLDEASKMVEEVLRPEINQLVQEINKTILHMASKARGTSVDLIYLSGGIAHSPAILNALSSQLESPVKILDPTTTFDAGKYAHLSQMGLGMRGGLALTTGLALRGIPDNG